MRRAFGIGDVGGKAVANDARMTTRARGMEERAG